MDFMIDVIKDSFFDSMKLLPLLFAIYLIVEYLEHKNNGAVHGIFNKSKNIGPLLGGVFGIIPQCGFSVIASELFAKHAITLGTLIAIFVSTSDEAIPLLLAHPEMFGDMLKLIVLKFVIAVAAGFAVDLVYESKTESHNESDHHFHGNCESCDDGVLKSAVVHAVRIFIFIFTVNILLGLAAEYISPAMEFVTHHKVLQAFVTALFGLIPNCAASVVLTELYIAGKITLGALVGGLCTGAGVGLVVLFKLNKSLKQNMTILALIYFIGAVSGIVLQFML
ncbi:MAG: putative manganese transporter [Firmicutes bacterium]|nr:putative manganese transporter [Bacillota bacterium]